MRAAIYTRKSIKADEKNPANSLEIQRSACENYCRSKGWEIVPDRYDDSGETGAKIDRPGFRRLVRDLKAKKFDIIVVYRYDRLTRSLLHFQSFLRFLEELRMRQKREVHISCATQQIDSTTPTGRFMINMIVSFGELERETISERQKGVYSHERSLGIIRHVSYGFRRISKNRIEVEPEEMKVLQRILKEKNEHKAYELIAEDLNLDGIHYRGGVPWRHEKCRQVLLRALELCRTRADLAGVEAAYLGEVRFKPIGRVRGPKVVSLDFSDY